MRQSGSRVFATIVLALSWSARAPASPSGARGGDAGAWALDAGAVPAASAAAAALERVQRLEQRLAMGQAEAERAVAEERSALETARQAALEAQRLVELERARLLDVGQRQAAFEGQLLKGQRMLTARGEAELGLRRRVRGELAAGEGTEPIDALYDTVHAALSDARAHLRQALQRSGTTASPVPAPGPSDLVRLPIEVDLSDVREQRARVLERSAELERLDRELARAAAKQLMAEVDNTNRLRLSLLPELSPLKRRSVLGLAPAGWEQASSELDQVVLTLRYHLHSALHWARDVRDQGFSQQAAWLTGEVALQALLTLAVFWWWRRRADSLLAAARRSLEERRRRRRDLRLRAGLLERCVRFVEGVRRPLTLLLLVRVLLALLPGPVRALLEVQVAGTILTWILSGVVVALGIDVLSSEEVERGQGGATETSALRLKSLRLAANAIVAFGLVLSLGDLVVGQGTIYAWVSASRWFVALPVLFAIVAWWRPIVFQRLSCLEQPNALQRWVLARRSGLGSFGAAALGGAFLFTHGAYRSAQAWLVDFTLTRRLLAYLFRRDLSKQARQAGARYSELAAPLFDALGPEADAPALIASAADSEADALSLRLSAPGGGVVAIVGERGSGKSAFLSRLSREPGSIGVRCPLGGVEPFRRVLSTALGLDTESEFAQVEQRLQAEPRVTRLLIDDAEHLIRPEMGGLAGFDRLLDVCRRSASRSVWVLAFDHGVWRFLEAARETRALFDEIVWMSAWREEGIVRLLTQRSRLSNVTPSFEHLLGDMSDDVHVLGRRMALQRTEANYYRLLWDYASGNPGVALHFWRRSLGVDDAGRVCVRLFDAPEAEALDGLPDSTVFVLRAIIQLGWASREDIVKVTALPGDSVADALRFGSRRGYFDIAAGLYRVNWDWFRAVSRFLERRHLLALGLRS
jgi:hypothetical protein